jgi:hypothetical protein
MLKKLTPISKPIGACGISSWLDFSGKPIIRQGNMVFERYLTAIPEEPL